MKIHVFNPEHDIALATDVSRFTAPHAGRAMRTELGFLPSLWAEDGDIVVVDDVEAAHEAVRHLRSYSHAVHFTTFDGLSGFLTGDLSHVSVQPWGWDRNVKDQLLRADARLEAVLPSDGRVCGVRNISNRRFAAENVLPAIVAIDNWMVGESCYCDSMDVVEQKIGLYGNSVLKAPWSCSGRGIRYVRRQLETQQRSWAENVIRRQGGVMIEPLYNKVMDFGVEFCSDGCGGVEYRGLSVFRTVNGAYTGNLLATENDKLALLDGYVPEKLLGRAIAELKSCLSPILKDKYEGAFGVDMMVVSASGYDGFLLHPCVEINFRMTMGHVALALSPSPFEPQRLMHIDYDGHYHFRISALKTTN